MCVMCTQYNVRANSVSSLARPTTTPFSLAPHTPKTPGHFTLCIILLLCAPANTRAQYTHEHTTTEMCIKAVCGWLGGWVCRRVWVEATNPIYIDALVAAAAVARLASSPPSAGCSGWALIHLIKYPAPIHPPSPLSEHHHHLSATSPTGVLLQ